MIDRGRMGILEYLSRRSMIHNRMTKHKTRSSGRSPLAVGDGNRRPQDQGRRRPIPVRLPKQTYMRIL
jgi:hypothetical protein